MAANINDKFSEVSTGTRPSPTTVASIRSVSGTSLVCDDLTGWATNTAVHFVTYQVDGQGNVVAGTQTDMKGIVSGNTISNIVITGGTDNGNAVGDIVQQLPTAAWAKDLADGLQVAHNSDGSLKAGIVDTTELADEAVTTAKIDDGAVVPGKLSLGASTATTSGSDSTITSSSYVSLTTSTSVTVGTSGVALVFITSALASNSNGTRPRLSFAATGANSVSASDDRSVYLTRADEFGAEMGTATGTFLLTGLNAGSTTFTLQGKRDSGSGNAIFRTRSIVVIPL